MRYAWVLSIVVIAACFEPTFRDCEILCNSGACPSGFSCVKGLCRVKGATDSCGAVGHDEDLDGIDDAVDVCPNVADDQLDSDGDGVGDACDPHPSLPIDRLRLFSDFRDFAGWTGVTGNWEAGSDAVMQGDQTGNLLATIDLSDLNDPTLIAVLTSADSGSDFFAVGLYLVTGVGNEAGLPAGLACYLALPAGRIYSYDNRTPGTPATEIAADTTLGYPARITLRASTPGTTPNSGPPSCSVLAPTSLRASVSPTTNLAPIASGTPGLYTYKASATFGSLVIIDRVP